MSRPCKYCVANWAGMARTDLGFEPIVPEPMDCEVAHRDDPRIYALATAIARTICAVRKPSDEQVGWYLGDADDVVDDFEPTPVRWTVRRLPGLKNDSWSGIEIRLRINDVTYVGLEGGKGDRGSVVRLSTFREWHKAGAP